MNFGNSEERNHGSSAIGWISNTDSMLLSIVILAAISAVFHNRWVNTVAENKKLTEQLVGADVMKLHETVAQIRRELEDAQKERDDALRRVEMLLTQLSSSGETVVDLHDKLKSAEEELAKLRPLPALLEETKRALAAAILARNKAEDLVAALQAKVGALTSDLSRATKRIAELTAQLEELQKLVATFQKDNTTLRKDIAKVSEELKKEKEKSADLLAKGKALYQKYLDAYNNWHDFEKKYLDLKDKVIPPDPIVKRKLLGLEGDLVKVAIILDASGSMKETEVESNKVTTTKDLWTPACDVVNTWLDLLEMKECVFVVFNSKTRVYPETGLLNMQLPSSRRGLREFLAPIKPEGGTNTRAALELVFDNYPDVDTIILFTDGGPNDGNQSVMDPEEARKIIDLCERKGIRVNTVGLGNYFEPKFGQFLQNLALKTKGAFLGR